MICAEVRKRASVRAYTHFNHSHSSDDLCAACVGVSVSASASIYNELTTQSKSNSRSKVVNISEHDAGGEGGSGRG